MEAGLAVGLIPQKAPIITQKAPSGHTGEFFLPVQTARLLPILRSALWIQRQGSVSRESLSRSFPTPQCGN
jgi:hypothetical protein